MVTGQTFHRVFQKWFERAVPSPERQRVLDRAEHVALGADDGVDDGMSEGEVRRHRRREGAAAAVGIPGVDARRVQLGEHAAVEEQIHDLVPLRMAAGDDDGSAAHLMDLVRRRARVLDRSDAAAAQHFGLGDVRGDHRASRQQLRPEHLEPIVVQQASAAFRDHHRVDDHQRQVQFLDRRGNGFDDRRRREHADLGGVQGDVAGDRFDLRRDEVGRQRQHLDHADRVLRGDGGNRARPVDTQGRERLEVGLDPGAAAGVAAGDGQRGNRLAHWEPRERLAFPNTSRY